jgi:hypothetical protein
MSNMINKFMDNSGPSPSQDSSIQYRRASLISKHHGLDFLKWDPNREIVLLQFGMMRLPNKYFLKSPERWKDRSWKSQ